MCLQLAVVRQVLRKELGLKIVEVDSSEKAMIEGGDVLWTGRQRRSIFLGPGQRLHILWSNGRLVYSPKKLHVWGKNMKQGFQQ